MERKLIAPRDDGDEFSRLYLIFDIPEARLAPPEERERAGCADLSRLRRTFEAALAGGAQMIQLRAKHLSAADLLRVAKILVPLARQVGARIYINTSAEVARETAADGVHRPTHGASVSALRAGSQMRVGVSTHSLQEALEAQAEGADFVTLSPIFSTPSKPGYGPALGLEYLQEVCAALTIPVYALAGITPQNAPNCRAAGAFGVAVMGGILGAGDPVTATRRYRQALAGEQS